MSSSPATSPLSTAQASLAPPAWTRTHWQGPELPTGPSPVVVPTLPDKGGAPARLLFQLSPHVRQASDWGEGLAQGTWRMCQGAGAGAPVD